MGERQTEYWANVYETACLTTGKKLAYVGPDHDSPERAMAAVSGFDNVGCRIHVRLKPEGAPRRYATITEQDAWEIDPVGSRYYAEQGNSLRYSAGSGFYVADYSLLQSTEESA